MLRLHKMSQLRAQPVYAESARPYGVVPLVGKLGCNGYLVGRLGAGFKGMDYLPGQRVGKLGLGYFAFG